MKNRSFLLSTLSALVLSLGACNASNNSIGGANAPVSEQRSHTSPSGNDGLSDQSIQAHTSSSGNDGPSDQSIQAHTSSPGNDGPSAQSITITWKNYDGSILEIDKNVPFGTIPTYDGPTPTKESTSDYMFSFDGWYPSVSGAIKDATYTAQFKQSFLEYDGMEFTTFGAGYSLTNYSGADERVVIPDNYHGKPVIAIGLFGTDLVTTPNGFCFNTFVKEVVLPKHLTAIYNQAFRGCTSLVSIDETNVEGKYDLNRSVFYGDTSFKEFTLSNKNSMYYPDSLSGSYIEKVIIDRDIKGNYSSEICVFMNCQHLKEVIVNCGEIGGDNLHLCDSTTCNVETVTFTNPNCIVHDHLFSGMTKLRTLALPTIDREITAFFGDSVSKGIPLELISGDENISLPTVSNVYISETQTTWYTVYAGDLGFIKVDITTPKTWGIDDYWFEYTDGKMYFLDDSKQWTLSYDSYTYRLNSLTQTVRYPYRIYGYFIAMPVNLSISVLSGSVDSMNQYLNHTGYSLNA